jgi:hypothetical protein
VLRRGTPGGIDGEAEEVGVPRVIEGVVVVVAVICAVFVVSITAVEEGSGVDLVDVVDVVEDNGLLIAVELGGIVVVGDIRPTLELS